ncbi:hypothetical protein ACX03_19625 [Vibrio parahaemolyticus]|nr:hypothetical protein ACX03_19625 [Vibrio parahaemolyticus]
MFKKLTALGAWVQVGLCFQGGTASLRWWPCSHLNSVLRNQNQYVIMNKEHSEAFILEIDKVLAPSGFKFIKSRRVWQRWEVNGVVSDSAIYGLLAKPLDSA